MVVRVHNLSSVGDLIGDFLKCLEAAGYITVYGDSFDMIPSQPNTHEWCEKMVTVMIEAGFDACIVEQLPQVINHKYPIDSDVVTANCPNAGLRGKITYHMQHLSDGYPMYGVDLYNSNLHLQFSENYLEPRRETDGTVSTHSI